MGRTGSPLIFIYCTSQILFVHEGVNVACLHFFLGLDYRLNALLLVNAQRYFKKLYFPPNFRQQSFVVLRLFCCLFFNLTLWLPLLLSRERREESKHCTKQTFFLDLLRFIGSQHGSQFCLDQSKQRIESELQTCSMLKVLFVCFAYSFSSLSHRKGLHAGRQKSLGTENGGITSSVGNKTEVFVVDAVGLASMLILLLIDKFPVVGQFFDCGKV